MREREIGNKIEKENGKMRERKKRQKETEM